ncbi:hypothetical protein AB4Z32_19955 [Massilia sp. 2TAF26]|uniref:hypothetical protein n=1 Tax=Massilia sp. 2TAF26 TaxID=3233012 RepID=UPI003F9632B8
MQDEAIYRCINETCGRPAPRPVNYCPWCGTAQAHAGTRTPSAATGSAAAVAAAAGASAAASLSGWSDAPPPAIAPEIKPEAKPEAKPELKPPVPPTPSATAFGHSAKGASTPPPPPTPPPAPPRQEVPRPPLAAHPPRRKPIRLRWWVLALVVLWGVWLMAKPSTKKIDRRIDAAISLARECKGSDAQAELIALRKTRATPEQLQRLQQALNDEAAICTKRRQRARAWSETSAAVESALAAAGWDKALARLQAFTKRWGEDEDTRAMKEGIEAARRDAAHPLAVPRSAAGSSGGGATGAGGGDKAQSAYNLIQSAQRDMANGNYGAAADKMTLCLTMVDAGNRECRALKTQAEQQAKFP